MLAVVLERVAAVDHRGARVEASLHGCGQERVDRRRLREQRAPVERDDSLEVRRLGRQRSRQRAHERFFVLARQQSVEAPLEADGRARLLAHPRPAAEGAADVPGPDLGEVAEAQQALHRPVEPARPLLLVDGEVGPGDVAHEQRVSGHSEPRLIAPAFVGDQIGGVLGPVPGRRERGDRDLP